MSLVRKSTRQHKATSAYKLSQLQSERAKWQRRLTIASNKLGETNRAIDAIADDLAHKAYPSEFTAAAK